MAFYRGFVENKCDDIHEETSALAQRDETVLHSLVKRPSITEYCCLVDICKTLAIACKMDLIIG